MSHTLYKINSTMKFHYIACTNPTTGSQRHEQLSQSSAVHRIRAQRLFVEGGLRCESREYNCMTDILRCGNETNDNASRLVRALSCSGFIGAFSATEGMRLYSFARPPITPTNRNFYLSENSLQLIKIVL